ncbi:MAG: helix-turn-helix domain-containing protein [Firmicutes bacterium]|nr:helix-turn-helix domain-containing protein [Bacillota bacterium]
MEKICENLKKLRIEKGFTQQQIAELLKIDRSNYSKYERGKLEPNLEMVICLAKFYDVSADYLLGLEE